MHTRSKKERFIQHIAQLYSTYHVQNLDTFYEDLVEQRIGRIAERDVGKRKGDYTSAANGQASCLVR